MSLVERAKNWAVVLHKGQFRKYGKRKYIYHPAKVVSYLKDKNYSKPELMAAAWLHDVVEDCNISYSWLENLFGLDVARLVEEVSHPAVATEIKPRSKRWQVYLEHYNNASHEGKVLKMADRICNLSEYVDYWDELDNKGRCFLSDVYLDESIDLLESLGGSVDVSITKDLICIINEVDELLSEEY